MKSFQITDWCHEIFERFVPAGGVYIDATMGQGQDTLFLCRLAGEEGQVWAFDIQGKALELTRELLEREGMDKRARLILCGHEHMDRYLALISAIFQAGITASPPGRRPAWRRWSRD